MYVYKCINLTIPYYLKCCDLRGNNPSSLLINNLNLYFSQAAMSQILNELNEDDAFNIVTFDSYSHPWSDTMRLAQRNNVDQAVSYVHNLIAEGGKDFLACCELCAQPQSQRRWLCFYFTFCSF